MGRKRRRRKNREQKPKTHSPTKTQTFHGKTWDGVPVKSGPALAAGLSATKGKPIVPTKAGSSTQTYGGSGYYSNPTYWKGKEVPSKWKCEHWRDEVVLADGITVLASGWHDKPGGLSYIERRDYPEIGCYFDSAWLPRGGWQSATWRGPRITQSSGKSQLAILSWPDYSVPNSLSKTIEVMEYLVEQAAAGKQVEIGCLGGHGRTGTAIALMQVILGMSADSAMEWVWDNYCYWAIESKSQESFIHSADRLYNPRWYEDEEIPLTEDETVDLVSAAKGELGSLIDPNSPDGKKKIESWVDDYLRQRDAKVESERMLEPNPSRSGSLVSSWKHQEIYEGKTGTWVQVGNGEWVPLESYDPELFEKVENENCSWCGFPLEDGCYCKYGDIATF